jgi:hypothetical protein
LVSASMKKVPFFLGSLLLVWYYFDLVG